MKNFTQSPKISVANLGFTLIEILIALPIASIVSLLLVTTMFDQYGILQQSTARANLRIEGEITLISLEDELLFATDFGEYLKTDLTDTHAPSGGWSHDSDPDTLIVYETALDADRRDPDREFVYKNLYGCSSSYNPIAINNLMYFTEDNVDDNYKTLYRRTITPNYSTCNINYKRETCPTAYVGTGTCLDQDAVLSDSVVDFQLEYYDDNNVLIPHSANVWDAEKIKVTLVLGEKIYGEDILVTTSITMKKVNG